jgi:hypothetical protein
VAKVETVALAATEELVPLVMVVLAVRVVWQGSVLLVA